MTKKENKKKNAKKATKSTYKKTYKSKKPGTKSFADSTVNVTEEVQGDNIQLSTGPVASNMSGSLFYPQQFNLAGILAAQLLSYANIFEMYRIKMIEMIFSPTFDQIDIGNADSSGTIQDFNVDFFAAIEYDPSESYAISTPSNLLSYAKAMQWHIDKTKTIKIYPKVPVFTNTVDASGTSGSTITTYMPKGTWYPISSPEVIHTGLLWATSGFTSTTANTAQVQVYFKYYIEFKLQR